MGNDAASHQLAWIENLAIAWALTWPMLIFDLVFWMLDSWVLRGAEWAYALNPFFCVGFLAPWVVRRTIHVDFAEFHLVAIRRASGQQSRQLTYGQSFRVAWLLGWRASAVFLLAFFLVYAAVWLLGGADLQYSPFAHHRGVLALVELIVGTALGLLLFSVWLVRAAIEKPYSDFGVKVLRTGSYAQASA